MSSNAKPYLRLKLSPSDRSRMLFRYLSQGVERESELEKPYLDDGYREVQLNDPYQMTFKKRLWPLLDDLFLPPLPPLPEFGPIQWPPFDWGDFTSPFNLDPNDGGSAGPFDPYPPWILNMTFPLPSCSIMSTETEIEPEELITLIAEMSSIQSTIGRRFVFTVTLDTEYITFEVMQEKGIVAAINLELLTCAGSPPATVTIQVKSEATKHLIRKTKQVITDRPKPTNLTFQSAMHAQAVKTAPEIPFNRGTVVAYHDQTKFDCGEKVLDVICADPEYLDIAMASNQGSRCCIWNIARGRYASASELGLAFDGSPRACNDFNPWRMATVSNKNGEVWSKSATGETAYAPLVSEYHCEEAMCYDQEAGFYSWSCNNTVGSATSARDCTSTFGDGHLDEGDKTGIETKWCDSCAPSLMIQSYNLTSQLGGAQESSLNSLRGYVYTGGESLENQYYTLTEQIGLSTPLTVGLNPIWNYYVSVVDSGGSIETTGLRTYIYGPIGFTASAYSDESVVQIFGFSVNLQKSAAYNGGYGFDGGPCCTVIYEFSFAQDSYDRLTHAQASAVQLSTADGPTPTVNQNPTSSKFKRDSGFESMLINLYNALIIQSGIAANQSFTNFQVFLDIRR